MKAVLMCAGRSTRTHPLTLTRPKPLLKVANKTLLEHNLDQLAGLVDEAVLIIGYMGGMLRNAMGSSYKGIGLSYVEQKGQLGTAHALLQAEGAVKGRFIVLMGDDLYSRQDIERCVRHDLSILGKEVDDPRRFGVIVAEGGRMTGLVEKPEHPTSRLANTGLYVLDESVFPEIRALNRSERGEYELTDAVAGIAKSRTVHVEKVAGFWFPIGYPWSLLDANEALLKSREAFVMEGVVEDGATIKGGVEIGKGTIVRAGSYIEGPVLIGRECDIGPNCHIRPSTSIGDRCKVGNCTEVKNSIIMDGSKVPHLSYISDSVVGENVNVGGGGIVANLRHDNGNVKSAFGGQLVDSGRRKFGTAIGDGAKLGAGTIIYPGRKIWPGRSTEPGELVKSDVE